MSKRQNAAKAGALLLTGLAAVSHAAASPYGLAETWSLPGDGGWDYPSVDPEAQRLYLSRENHVAIVDTTTGRLVGDIPDTPGVHGIALAPDIGHGFISAGKVNQVKVFDLRTDALIASITVGAKPDAILYEPHTRRIFVFNGHDDSASVIDPTSNTVVATIALGGGPEFARSDGSAHVFVNLEDKNELAVIDLRTLEVTARWPLPGCNGPTGLALDAAHHRSFSVCGNAVLVILDTDSGRLLATLPIGQRVDGAEFDPGAQNLFSANGDGTLTVVHETDPQHFSVVQTLPTAKGARTIALDPRTHRLFLPTARFGPVKPTAQDANPRPPILPDSFVVLVVADRTGRAEVADKSTDIGTRLAAQNALFEDWYQSDLIANPERATAYGDYRYNDRLDGRSLAALRAVHASDQDYVARLGAIPTTGFSDQDVMSHQILLRALQQRIANYGFKEFEMPVSQMDGPHLEFADLPLAVPFESIKQYEDYIARLHQIPLAFAESEEVLRAGMKDHLMPVRFLLEKVPAQCEGIIRADPFLLPTRKFPAGISSEDQQRLTRAITDAVTNEVLPAYQAFGAFIATEYAPHGRAALTVTSLPGGEQRYLNEIRSRTTVSTLSPDQIHQLGLREIERIEAEMRVIARREGFADIDSYRKSLQANAKYRPVSADQILEDFRKYIAQMQPELPKLFGYIPASPITVEAIPDFQAAMATHYQTGTPDGHRPGRVVVATSNFAERSLIDDEAIAYHEGIPGHHMQRSVAQQMTGLPKFRQHIGNSGYIEGWALYAEQLGKEVGFYQDAASDYGRLASELFRAARLVVDTGIHSKAWTRDQVIDFLRKTGSIDEPSVQSETDRYIAWPAQALSYKLGQLKFRELRERAQRELGENFDIRSFHDEMLSGGVLPLDLLEARTDDWIAAQKRTVKAAAIH